MECAQCISKKRGGRCQKEICVLLLKVKNFPKAVFGECANYIAKRSCRLLEALHNCVHKDHHTILLIGRTIPSISFFTRS